MEHRYPMLQQGFLGVTSRAGVTTTLTGNDSGKAYTNIGATGSTTYNLPKAVPGLRYIFVDSNAQNLVIQPKAADSIRGSAAGVPTTLSSAGAKLLCTCVIAGFWENI
jgi:hypothetical protein